MPSATSLKLLGVLILNSEISGRAEDYLRSIYEIVERKGFARVKDIARELNVKPSSVVEMLKKLHRLGDIKSQQASAS